VPRARIQDRDVLDSLLVDETLQLRVDLARGEVLGVELRLVAVDLRDVRNLVVELDQPAGVEQDLSVRGYRVQTITSPS
jgi:hypothetical protein